MKHALALVLFLCANVCMAERTFYLRAGDSGEVLGPYLFKEGTSIPISNAMYRISQIVAASNTFCLTSPQPAQQVGPFTLRNGQRGVLANMPFQIDVVDRVGLCGFSGKKVDENARRRGDSVTDLLFVNLAKNTGLELVERKDIKKALDEISLTTDGLTDPGQAVKIGKMVGADYMVVGRLYSESGTNSVVAKVVDVSRGVIREINVFPLKDESLPQCAEGIGTLVLKAAGGESAADQKRFLAVGSFRDKSLTQLYVNLADDLRKFLEPHYSSKPGMGVVERSLLKPLLAEMGLNEQGMIQEGSTFDSVQAAFLVVSGVYDVFRGKDTKIAMDLQISRIGGERYQEKIEANAGDDLNHKISAVMNMYLNSVAKSNAPDPRAEARFQFQEGLRLSGLGIGQLKALDPDYILTYDSHLGSHPDETTIFYFQSREGSSSPRHIKIIEQAIEAFEAAAFLNHDDNDAKLCLALCLDSAPIGDYSRSVPMLEDIMKHAEDESIRYVAAFRLWRERELSLSAEFRKKLGEHPGIRHKAFNVDEFIRKGRISQEEALSVLRESVLSHCEAVNRSTEDGRIVDRRTFDLEIGQADLDLFRMGRLDGWEAGAKVVEEASKSFPRAAAYARNEYYCDNVPKGIPQEVQFFNSLLSDAEHGTSKYVDMQYLLTRLANRYGFFHLDRPERVERICKLLDSRGTDSTKLKRELLRVYETKGDSKKVAVLMKELGETEPPTKKAEKERDARLGPRRFDLGRPQFVFETPILCLAQDGAGDLAVVTLRTHVHVVKPSTRETEEFPLPWRIRDLTTAAVAMNRERIWVGTKRGLIEINRTTKKYRLYAEKEGLLAPLVRSLCLIGDRLWVGLDKDSGYLDTRTSQFVGVSAMGRAHLMAEGTGGNLWVSDAYGNVGHLQAEKLTKSPVPGGYTSTCHECMTANERYVMLGTWSAVGRMSGGPYGGFAFYDTKMNTWRTVSSELPYAEVYSMAVVGDRAWVSGQSQYAGDPGYIAIVDLTTGKVVNTCRLDPVYVPNAHFQKYGYALLRGSRGVWVGAGSKLYCMDDSQTPALANPNGPQTPTTGTVQRLPAMPPDAVAKLSYDGTLDSYRKIAEAALPAAREGNIVAICIVGQVWIALGQDSRLDSLPISEAREIDKEVLAAWQKMIQDKANKGDTFFLDVLAIQYLFGYNVAKDEAKGRKIWEDLAARGDGYANHKIACMLGASGNSTPERVREFLAYEKRAADKGIPSAIYNLGCWYSESPHVDDKQAADYFTKAATLGHPVAARNLGIFYINGQGVEASRAKAQMWFEKGEEAGDLGSMQWLEELSQNGGQPSTGADSE